MAEIRNTNFLINFQNKPLKPVMKEFCDNDLEFFNFYQSKYCEDVKNKKNYIVIFRIKEVLLRCYPMLIMANKRGMSLSKILSKYNVNNIPSFETSNIQILNKLVCFLFLYFLFFIFIILYEIILFISEDNFNYFLGNLKKGTLQDSDVKKKKNLSSLKSVKENESDSFDDMELKGLGTDHSFDKESM